MRQNHGKALSMYDISGLFGAAYLKAATISNGVSGFSKTGIWPVDENMFMGVTFNDRTDTTSPNVATSIATNSVQAAPTATSVTTLVSPQDTSGSRAAMCSKIDSSTKVTSQHAVKCDDIDMPSDTPNGNDILARKTFFEHLLLAMEKLTTTKELLSFCASPSCRIPDRFEIPAQHVTTIVASKLTVDKVALCCQAVIRNLVYRFMCRLQASNNCLVMSIQSSSLVYTSRIRKHWRSLLYVYG